MLHFTVSLTGNGVSVTEATEPLGQSFYRANVLECLFRDVQASSFRPLPKWEQYAFTGERLFKD